MSTSLLLRHSPISVFVVGAPLLEKYKFKFFVSQLEQMGLVYCSDLDGYDNHHQVLATGESKESSAGVTPMGEDFLIYLKSDF